MNWNQVKESMFSNDQTYLGTVYVFRVADLDGIVWQTSFNDVSYDTLEDAKQALDDLTLYSLQNTAA